jgi:hypothetical protein
MFSNVVILDVNMFGLVIEDKKGKEHMMKWREKETFLHLTSTTCKK